MVCRVIGHRGARGLYPENTREGIEAAALLGLTCFEIDVGSTRDGVAVVHHDPALNPDFARGADGAWVPADARPLLRDLSTEELRTYDVGTLRPGSATRDTFPEQEPRPGARVPELRELLALDARWEWLLEVKTHPDRPGLTLPPDELAVLALAAADEAGAAGRCTFISFEWRVQRALRRARPGLTLGWLTRQATLADGGTWLGLDRSVTTADVPGIIADEGGGAWMASEQELTPALVGSAHTLGIPVFPWTVNDRGRMCELVGYGVDGIITDYPDRLLAVLAENGVPPRPG